MGHAIAKVSSSPAYSAPRSRRSAPANSRPPSPTSNFNLPRRPASVASVLRLVLAIHVLLGLFGPLAAGPVSTATRRAIRPDPAPETRYTDLIAWGRSRGFGAKSSAGSDELKLYTKSQELVFKANTKKVLFDETDVRLTLPIRKVGEGFQVSKRDLETLLNPLLAPPRRPARQPIRTIALNAGHGGKDPGNTEGRRQEKYYTLLLSGEVRRRLERAGLRVVLVRSTDTFIELEDRPAAATKAKADLYLSVHFNAFDGPGSADVGGVETYCLTPAGASSTNDTGNHGGRWNAGNRFDHDNIVLGHQVHRAIVQGTDLSDRGLRRARFKELTLLDMPGILVEGGYMTNAHDASTIYSVDGRSTLARAIADGVLAYKRLVERTP